MNSQAAAKLAEFERFASELETEDGDPFVLEAFQKTILSDYFSGTRSTVIILPKKNGKTTLIAALALYHVLVTPNADCIVVAASREQAGICLRAARIFVRNSPQLSRLMSVHQRTISVNGEEGRIRVLASDEDTLDGENPTLAIVDELHRHKDLDVYGVLSDGMTRPGAAMVTISTAGSDLASPLGVIRAGAHEMKGFKRKGTYNHVLSPDKAFAFHEWCLDPDADTDDLKVVKTANPAPWQTIERLRLRKDEPGMTTYRWLRFACGIWTEGEEPWLEPTVWDRLAVDEETAPGENVWAAVVVGNQGEESAITLIGKVAQAQIYPPDTTLEHLEAEVRALADGYRLASVSFVPRQFARSAEMLAKEGLRMLEFPLSVERMSKGSTTLYRLIERGELHHTGAPDFRAHVMAGVVKEDEQGWRLVKAGRPVAALIGLVMAVQASADAPPVREAMMAWA